MKLSKLFDYGFKPPSRSQTPRRAIKRRRKTNEQIARKFPSMRAFFDPINAHKRDVVGRHLKKRQLDKSTIGISWRDDGYGKGARYDHAAIQLMTNVSTAVINAEQASQYSNFGHALNSLPYELPYVERSARFNGKKIPPIIPDEESDKEKEGLSESEEDEANEQAKNSLMGLIIIPGVSYTVFKNKREYAKRKEQELELIKGARNRGQPILAICGGAWVLGEAFGASIRAVAEHAYRGGMPRLSEGSFKITHSKNIHQIKVTEHAYVLKVAMRVSADASPPIAVNSLHSYAVSEEGFPTHVLTPSAYSVPNPSLAPINTHSETKEKLNPEHCIEAFETRHAAPVLGIQWHPEAYSPNVAEQKSLIQWMTKAGHTYQAKQCVNEEILEHGVQKKEQLHRTKLLKIGRIIRRNNQFVFYSLDAKPSDQLRHQGEYEAEIQRAEQFSGMAL